MENRKIENGISFLAFLRSNILLYDDIDPLSDVANVHNDMLYFDLADQVREKIKRFLGAKCSKPSTSPSIIAHVVSIYNSEMNNEASVECYGQTLAREYDQIECRLELANIMTIMDKLTKSMVKAKICLQLRPQLKAAKTLIEDLSVNSDTLCGTGSIALKAIQVSL